MSRVEWLRGHRRADLLLLHELWMAGLSLDEIARRFGKSQSTIVKWANHYKLPRRHTNPVGEPPPPSPEDEAASLSGLALSPWVAAKAEEVKQRHYAERRGETDLTAREWRAGISQRSSLA